MVLITGGYGQGKLEYALETLGITGENVIDCGVCDYDSIFTGEILNNFHLIIKRMLEDNIDINAYINMLIERNPNAIVIVNEMGCGVVPVDLFERKYRETTGRVSCVLAKNSHQVHRITCGLGMVIKDD